MVMIVLMGFTTHSAPSTSASTFTRTMFPVFLSRLFRVFQAPLLGAIWLICRLELLAPLLVVLGIVPLTLNGRQLVRVRVSSSYSLFVDRIDVVTNAVEIQVFSSSCLKGDRDDCLQ